MRLVDYHSHSTRCRHATGELEEYVLRARQLGLREYGISDHCPWMLQQIGQHMAMEWDQLPGYVKEVKGLQEKYNREGEDSFHVRLGLEMDFIPCRLAEARRVIERYDWDYLLGSVHSTGLGMIADAYYSGILEKFSPEVVCEYYFHALGEMIDARFCDVIAHMDLPKKFNMIPRGGFMRWVEPLIPRIKKAGMVVEINTSGREVGPQEAHPGWEILEALVAAGVPLTLSSDAHSPQHIGRYFGEVVKKLHCLGVREIATFEKRQVIMVPLEGSSEQSSAPMAACK